jgi:exonuclease SbcC
VEAGFATGEQYRAARLGVTELDALARAVEGYRTQCASASERLARAQDATKDLTRPEMEAITIRLSEVRSQIEQALQKSAALSSHIDQVQQQLTDLKTAMDEATAAEGRYAVMGKITEVANGKNAHGITLQRYVLAALLDDVLAAASERLRIMSQGRFQLHRARERTDLRATGGLDLEIFDAYSGSSRPAHTLSGGEQFLASLSLALGLADVVQGYAGGIRLETIFIDEGFGSLDPETLEYAFRALVELQKSGRLVGVISHMSGLKELIPARLAVMPKGDGTSTAHIVL